MKTLSKAIILGLGLALPLGAMAVTDADEVTIRVMEANETTSSHVMEDIDLPDVADEHATDNAQTGLDHANDDSSSDHKDMTEDEEHAMEQEREHEEEMEQEHENEMDDNEHDRNDVNDRVNEDREEHESRGEDGPESPDDMDGPDDDMSGNPGAGAGAANPGSDSGMSGPNS